ncbi:hypothetical protein AXG93_4697s1340 [Marchantia polymorpha subsp. ruderalis]|uniref:Uncharacterized protein n=1 Tax=Marchantia polymorpha subsp. ruderalis TaxID=1480154 RepID=A0A176VPB5_MARPO|nr:hypothetical protein AXG93_4697s1340 [Marchantia polymorpha subsp. ruderalis]
MLDASIHSVRTRGERKVHVHLSQGQIEPSREDGEGGSDAGDDGRAADRAAHGEIGAGRGRRRVLLHDEELPGLRRVVSESQRGIVLIVRLLHHPAALDVVDQLSALDMDDILAWLQARGASYESVSADGVIETVAST